MVNMRGQDFREYWQNFCTRFRENERYDELLQECAFVLWRIWKCRSEMIFNGVLVDPTEMVNLVRKQILEF